MRARRIAVVITAVAAVAALAGCSSEPGMVAEVEGVTITEADLDRVSTELGPFLADPSRGSVLTALVQSEAGGVLAERNDIEVTDDEAAGFLDSLATSSGVESSDWGDGSLTIARMQLVGQEVARQAGTEAALDQLTEIFAGLDVTVNPRFGEYDPATGEVRALAPAWIVTPGADEPPAPK